MQYKTELHAHSSEVSPCSRATAHELVDIYVKAGYSTLVLTNHLTSPILCGRGESWEEQIDFFLSPLQPMREYAKDRLHILLGAELRFDGNGNDYLLFGVDESFLKSLPELFRMRHKDFIAIARERGVLVIQAHPFRNNMRIVAPELLDGCEVYNGHAGHDSRNDLADLWARRYRFVRTSGSDYHYPDRDPSGGILTDEPITSNAKLIEILRSGSYTLICRGPAAERDGMCDMPAKY